MSRSILIDSPIIVRKLFLNHFIFVACRVSHQFSYETDYGRLIKLKELSTDLNSQKKPAHSEIFDQIIQPNMDFFQFQLWLEICN